jgi:hypothetical protein
MLPFSRMDHDHYALIIMGMTLRMPGYLLLWRKIYIFVVTLIKKNKTY